MSYVIDEKKLDPGIRNVAKFLSDYHFKVIEAGDGTNPKSPFEYPYLYLKIDHYSIAPDADRLYRLIKRVCPKSNPSIEAIYDPEDKVALIGVYHFDDVAFADRDKNTI